MTFNKWLDTFLSEKEIDINTEFTVESSGVIHFVSLDLLLNFIKKQPEETKSKIKKSIVYLDFHNSDVLDFFNHMAKGYILSIGM